MAIKVWTQNIMALLLLLLWCFLLFTGSIANALSYDYTATIECLATPHKPQYNGGIISNPEFYNGLEGWSTFGDAKIEQRKIEGNNFAVAYNRTKPHDSISHKLNLEKDKLYTFSVWIQVNEGSAPVTAIIKTSSGFKYAGSVIAEANCWSMLKGGLTVDASGPADLYFESNNSSVEIWIDSISLQPFTEEEWKSHQDQSIEQTRMSKVKIQVLDKQGNILPNATISIEQKSMNFPFGCAINKNILQNSAYQNWFIPRFKVTVFEDEMKWYSTEGAGQGKLDYSVPDAMMNFAKQHNVAVRGHNVLWDDPKYQPGWVYSISRRDLHNAAVSRVNSLMSRYKGQVIGWDVVNENMHFSFFEGKLGATASGYFYNYAHKVDSATTLFLNEYNTIEDNQDLFSSPDRYLEKLRQIRAYPGSSALNLGIGLESHFRTPNIPYMRSSIDKLAAANIPIWLTEVDVESGPNQANYLEQILREGHAHPKVSGIVIWSAWKPQGCYKMCLTDNNFKNLATGNVVDKLLGEWGNGPDEESTIVGTTDSNGFFEATLFHGEYEVKFQDKRTNFSLTPEKRARVVLFEADA